jgi:transcriptional pleiotropic regulator of transition state genes
MEVKSTGIVRRIDDLGRVVIPKEQRRLMGILEGDPLELFWNGEYLCFKKYDASYPVVSTIKTLCEQLNEPRILNGMDEADILTIQAFAKMLKKNLNAIAKNEEDISRG